MSKRDSIKAEARSCLREGRAMAIIGEEAGLGKSFLARGAFPEAPTVISGTFVPTITLEVWALSQELGLKEGESADIKEGVQALREGLSSGRVQAPGGGILFDDVRDPESILPYLIPGMGTLITGPSAVFSGVAPETRLPILDLKDGAELWLSLHGEGPVPRWSNMLGGLPLAIELAGPLLGAKHWDANSIQRTLERELGAEPASSNPGPLPRFEADDGGMAAWLEFQMAQANQRRSAGRQPESPGPSVRALIALPMSQLDKDRRVHLGVRALYGPGALPEALLRGEGVVATDLIHLGCPLLAEGWLGGELHGAIQGAVLGYLRPEELGLCLEQAAQGWVEAFEAVPVSQVRERDAYILHLLHMSARARGRGLTVETLLRAQFAGAQWIARRGLPMEAQVLFEEILGDVNGAAIEIPWRGDIHRELARIFREMGHNSEAQYQLEEATRHIEGKLGPDHPIVTSLNKERVALLKVQFAAVNQGLLDLS